MIKSIRQLIEAKRRLRDLRNEISEIDKIYSGIEREMFSVPYLQELEELEDEISEYEQLSDGTLREALRGLLRKPTLIDDIGQLLAKLRIAANLTQTELAERLGWQQANVSRFENENYHSQTVGKIVEYASSLGVWLYVVPEMTELSKNEKYERKTSSREFDGMFPISRNVELGAEWRVSNVLEQESRIPDTSSQAITGAPQKRSAQFKGPEFKGLERGVRRKMVVSGSVLEAEVTSI
jgi:transcriptional regulator with XRE-family HTH domain